MGSQRSRCSTEGEILHSLMCSWGWQWCFLWLLKKKGMEPQSMSSMNQKGASGKAWSQDGCVSWMSVRFSAMTHPGFVCEAWYTSTSHIAVAERPAEVPSRAILKSEEESRQDWGGQGGVTDKDSTWSHKVKTYMAVWPLIGWIA